MPNQIISQYSNQIPYWWAGSNNFLRWFCPQALNTSVTSIESLFKFYPNFLEKLNPECKIATIGHKTAELAIKNELDISIIPKDYTAEGLLEEFEKRFNRCYRCVKSLGTKPS